MQLLPAVVVDDMATFVNSVASFTHPTALLVNKASCILRVLRDNTDSVSINIEVTSYGVTIEVVLLDTERSRYLSLLVQFLLGEHPFSIHVVYDIASPIINKIASFISWLAVLIEILAALRVLLRSNYIAFLVSWEVAHDVAFVELPRLSIWRHLDCCTAVWSKLAHLVTLRHHERKLRLIIRSLILFQFSSLCLVLLLFSLEVKLLLLQFDLVNLSLFSLLFPTLLLVEFILLLLMLSSLLSLLSSSSSCLFSFSFSLFLEEFDLLIFVVLIISFLDSVQSIVFLGGIAHLISLLVILSIDLTVVLVLAASLLLLLLPSGVVVLIKSGNQEVSFCSFTGQSSGDVVKSGLSSSL